MTYRDQWATCEKCGKKFVFRVEDQRRQASMGFEVETPTRCPDCVEVLESGAGLRQGVIKWYSDEKHFGFIVQRDGSEVFFHRSNFLGENPAEVLKDNAPVWYEVQASDRGPTAVNVHLRE